MKISGNDNVVAYAYTFSYVSALACTEKSISDIEKSTYTCLSVMNGLGYLPIIGTIIGLARIIFTQCFDPFYKPELLCSSSKDLKLLRETQMVRGLAECASVLGVLMMIADATITGLIYAFGDKKSDSV